MGLKIGDEIVRINNFDDANTIFDRFFEISNWNMLEPFLKRTF